MKKSLFAVAMCGLFIGGCATTYEAPVATMQSNSIKTNHSKQDIFNSAQKVLARDGFQIMSANADTGVISTAVKDYRLTPALANCGKTMGLDYLKDQRTNTRVGFNIIVDANSFDIKTILQADYGKGDMIQGVTLSCTSTGVLEKQLSDKILADLK